MGQMPLACFPQTNNHVATIGVILMEEHDHERCVCISQKKFKAISKVVKNKTILQKFIHHIEGLSDERSGECIKA